ncbi:uncharacterized protein LY89DRAFT_256690 [Mollisia scopiformis]|uniref:C2H2-type domain-containing protein n=1 Tax=Mollisia scopiformis TaxID=149040 RepID=A0A132BCX4_MOLSC|nr:uncharacterized protein LY89DRAFT_256690 [Mollisia scopiformis]KUJ10280.1 hypothetical protein LY89DRAFT_256690 [Mollisia scopiformis]
MANTTFREHLDVYRRPGVDRSFTTSPHVSFASIPDYAHTSQDDSEPWVHAQQYAEGYGNVENCGSCGEFGNLCLCEDNSTTPIGDVAMDGSWNHGYPPTTDRMEWSFVPGLRSLRGRSDRVMNGMGEQEEEEVGGIEGSDDQRSKRPPEPDLETGPYSSTNAGASSICSDSQEQSEGNVSKQAYSPNQDGHDHASEGELLQHGEDLDVEFHPSPCLLGGCRGTYVFKTLSSYRTHLKNVHDKIIYCRVSECSRSHTKPFTSETDRRRHHQAKHNSNPDKPFKCVRSVCPARVRAFKRKDKLSEHNKKYHAQSLCHICSCYFDSFEEMLAHTNFGHGSFGSERQDV